MIPEGANSKTSKSGSVQNHAPSNASSISGSVQNDAPSNASSMENKNKSIIYKREDDAPSIQASGNEKSTDHSLKTSGVEEKDCAPQNFMMQEINLKNGNKEPIRLTFYVDDSETSKSIVTMLTKNNTDLLLMPFVGKSDAFIKFALEKFILECQIENEGLHSGMYLKKFSSAIVRLMVMWEKEFNKKQKDLTWFHQELSKYESSYPSEHITSFKDYYLTLLPSGSYQFQIIHNFKMNLSLEGWRGIQSKKYNGKNGNHTKAGVKGVTISDVAKMSEAEQLKYYSGGN